MVVSAKKAVWVYAIIPNLKVSVAYFEVSQKSVTDNRH